MNFRKTKKKVVSKNFFSVSLFSLFSLIITSKSKGKKSFIEKKYYSAIQALRMGKKFIKTRKRKFYCSTRSFVVYWCHNFINLGMISMEKSSAVCWTMDSSSKWLVPKFFNYSSTNSWNSLGSKIVLLRWRDFVTLYFHRYHQRRH